MSGRAYPYYQPDMERTAEDVLKNTAYQFAVCLGEEQPRPLILHRSSGSAHHMLYKTERAARQGRSRVVGKTNWFAEEIVVIERRQAANEAADARYPEHAKLAKVGEESQAIGEFIDFGMPRLGLNFYAEYEVDCECRACGDSRARHFHTEEELATAVVDEHGRITTPVKYKKMLPATKSIQAILAEYFGIDQDKIEAEKRAMLEELRAA
jgi:hypothetical protein